MILTCALLLHGQYATDLTARWQAPTVTTLSLGLG
jgi:hypothetical protein